jgi:hypothetical protein
MSKDLEQQLRPDLPFLRKWVKLFKKKHGDTSLSTGLIKLVEYAYYMEDRVKQLELYNECFQRLLEEQDIKCQKKKS